jgi:uncharacterized protein (DUF1778 family)
METKSEPRGLRFRPGELRLIDEARTAMGQSQADFIREASVGRARAILKVAYASRGKEGS